MSSHVLQGDPDIPLILRPSARARRITLRVSQVDGRVTITLPRHVAEREALAFAAQKEAWIRKHLNGRVTTVRMAPGAVLPVAGQEVTLDFGSGRSVRLANRVIEIDDVFDAMLVIETTESNHRHLEECSGGTWTSGPPLATATA